MRDYRNEIEPIKDATHKSFEFDVYRINEFEEWKKIKTIKLIDYQKKVYCCGSSGLDLYHRKNGKKIELLTIEIYDLYMDPKQCTEDIKKKGLKRNYITLETLNTILWMTDNENWEFSY